MKDTRVKEGMPMGNGSSSSQKQKSMCPSIQRKLTNQILNGGLAIHLQYKEWQWQGI
jgi:hypothetical protein